MDVREKLVELLDKGVRCPGIVDSCVDCPYHSSDNPCDELQATVDMLIAHGVTVMSELGKCPYCGGELKVEPFMYQIAELPKPIKLFGRWSLIKMRYREIPVKYSVYCENYCDGFTDYAPLSSGSTREEAIEDWNRKVNDVNLH